LKSKAFTLLECLVALFVLSGSVLVIEGLAKLIRHETQLMQNQTAQDWQSFCVQFRAELDGSQFVSADSHFLYLQKSGTYRYGLSNASDFRKTNAAGQGYQPMIYGIKSAQISVSAAHILTLTLDFQKGGTRTFLYKFQEKPNAQEKLTPASSSTP
jgi:competence protein ComGF